jgi:rhomboid protease GluP
LLYLLSGVGGAAASYWYHPSIPSAGASGSIFGLLGVLLVFSVKYRRAVPAFFSKALGRGILLTIGINLFIGWRIPQIDLAAHLGGLLSGGLLAVLVPFARPGEVERPVYKVIQALLVLVIGVSFFEVATHYNGPAPSVTNLKRALKPEDTTRKFLDAMNKADIAFQNSETVLESGDFRRLPDAEHELESAIDAMSDIPSFGPRADELSAQFLDLLRKQYEYVLEVQRTGRARSDFIGTSPQSRAYRSLNSRLSEWVEKEGANYGIEHTK